MSPSGAGRGDPFARDPAAVVRDVKAGLLSPAAAARDYAVVIEAGADRRPSDMIREAFADYMDRGPGG